MTDLYSPPQVAAASVRVETNRPRVTAATPGRQFRDALGETPAALLSGVDAATSLLPGGGIVSAAVRETAGSAAAPAAGSGANASPDLASLVGSAADENMRLLLLQEQISAENRRYTALSNVLKARHETAKAAVNNIR